MSRINRNGTLRIVTLGIIIAIIILMAGFYIYTLDYYRALPEVHTIIANTPLYIETKGNLTIIHAAADNKTQEGVIFYPGGKVEANAYLPLLVDLAERGYTSVLVKMPFNLAVFNVNAAESVRTAVTDIDSWTVVGHSLGGAMASSHMEKKHTLYKGLVLLGAYEVNDAPIRTLAIYGTYDLMLDLQKVSTSDQIVEIEGGNHAYFGHYGEQKGDGVALISRESQQMRTVELIIEFIESN